MCLEKKLKKLRKEKRLLDEQIAACEQSLINQHQTELIDSLSDKPEPYGDITIGDIVFKVPKYVKWDNDKLIYIASQIRESGGDPHDWIDFKLSVTETKFKALPDVLKSKFKSARKVSAGKINISFKE